MSGSRLSALQVEILRTLGDISPAWTLTGGGALSGFYSMHRTTRDLDLFWRGMESLGDLGRRVVDHLRANGFDVQSVQSSPTFHRLSVRSTSDSCIVDLVAEPTLALEEPQTRSIEGATIRIDSLHEILVNKLCALLGRSELRDLYDVQVLLEQGGDLRRALADAPKRDTGFSPLTLAWVLKDMPLEHLSASADEATTDLQGLERFRRDLIELLAQHASPT